MATEAFGQAGWTTGLDVSGPPTAHEQAVAYGACKNVLFFHQGNNRRADDEENEERSFSYSSRSGGSRSGTGAGTASTASAWAAAAATASGRMVWRPILSQCLSLKSEAGAHWSCPLPAGLLVSWCLGSPAAFYEKVAYRETAKGAAFSRRQTREGIEPMWEVGKEMSKKGEQITAPGGCSKKGKKPSFRWTAAEHRLLAASRRSPLFIERNGSVGRIVQSTAYGINHISNASLLSLPILFLSSVQL